MEKRKRGRPKVDTHLTQGHYDNRRKELNYKYMFEGTGVLMDATDEIPERTILYEMDKENRCFKACKTGIGRYIVAHGKVTIFSAFPTLASGASIARETTMRLGRERASVR